jgi:hypothetical protein
MPRPQPILVALTDRPLFRLEEMSHRMRSAASAGLPALRMDSAAAAAIPLARAEESAVTPRSLKAASSLAVRNSAMTTSPVSRRSSSRLGYRSIRPPKAHRSAISADGGTGARL